MISKRREKLYEPKSIPVIGKYLTLIVKYRYEAVPIMQKSSNYHGTNKGTKSCDLPNMQIINDGFKKQ